MKKTFLKYLLAAFIGIGICVIVMTLSWNRPPAYQPFPQGSATLDFPNTAAGAESDLTITVTGAALNDIVMLGVPNGSVSATDNVGYWAWVSSANTVTVRFNNGNLLAAVNPASGIFTAMICKH